MNPARVVSAFCFSLCAICWHAVTLPPMVITQQAAQSLAALNMPVAAGVCTPRERQRALPVVIPFGMVRHIRSTLAAASARQRGEFVLDLHLRAIERHARGINQLLTFRLTGYNSSVSRRGPTVSIRRPNADLPVPAEELPHMPRVSDHAGSRERSR